MPPSPPLNRRKPPPPYVVTGEVIATRQNLLIYGPQGVGKTLFAAQAQDHPLMSDVMFLNIEGGLTTVAHRRDIKAIDIRSTTDLESVFWALAAGDYPGVRTLVIDSVTELQTIALEEITSKAVAEKKGRRTDIDDIYQDDYGVSTVRLKRLLRWYRDLPMNVIFTALPLNVYPRGVENAEPIEVAPALTTSLRNSVMGYMDAVWYLFMREVELPGQEQVPVAERKRESARYLLTQNKGVYRAKTRGAQFARAMGTYYRLEEEAPNLPKIYDLLISSEGGDIKKIGQRQEQEEAPTSTPEAPEESNLTRAEELEEQANG